MAVQQMHRSQLESQQMHRSWLIIHRVDQSNWWEQGGGEAEAGGWRKAWKEYIDEKKDHNHHQRVNKKLVLIIDNHQWGSPVGRVVVAVPNFTIHLPAVLNLYITLLWGGWSSWCQQLSDHLLTVEKRYLWKLTMKLVSAWPSLFPARQT